MDANTVHHIYPVEDYPKYEYCDWNLISLCEKCHTGMHDRTTNKLTDKGTSLMQRKGPNKSADLSKIMKIMMM